MAAKAAVRRVLAVTVPFSDQDALEEIELIR